MPADRRAHVLYADVALDVADDQVTQLSADPDDQPGEDELDPEQNAASEREKGKQS